MCECDSPTPGEEIVSDRQIDLADEHPVVVDIGRAVEKKAVVVGIVAGDFQLIASRPGNIGERAYETFVNSLQRGLLIRVTGDTIAFTAPDRGESSHPPDRVHARRDVEGHFLISFRGHEPVPSYDGWNEEKQRNGFRCVRRIREIVRLPGIELQSITFIQKNDFLVDLNAHAALEHKDKLFIRLQ
jgi:hypothetical protein